MGFFSRLPMPRGMRRAAHPEHAVAQAAAPEAVVANGASHPAVSAAHVMQPPAAAAAGPAANGSTGVWHHDNCKINHRSPEAAAKCRNR
jgi:hypothetical protein